MTGRIAGASFLIAGLLCAAWFGAGFLDGPVGMFPGGRLDGPDTDCAGVDWGRFAAVREVELEVWPARPRSLTTWSVVDGGELFVPGDFLTPWKRWPDQVLEDDRVRLRIGGRIFACRAERIADGARIDRLRAATAAKYDLAPDGRAARATVWWFRIGPR